MSVFGIRVTGVRTAIVLWYNMSKKNCFQKKQKMENQNLNPKPIPQLPASKKWYNHKGILVIILLALIAGTAVWVFFILNQPLYLGPVIVPHKHSNEQPMGNASSTSVLAIEPTVSSTPTLVDTTNWQTFTDNSLGVTIKFPKQWYIVDNSLNLSSINPSAAPTDSAPKNDVFFGISPIAFQNTLPIDQWYVQYFSDKSLNGIISKNYTTVGGLPAIEVNTVYNYTGTPYSETWYYVTNSGVVFEIQTRESDQKNVNIYQTILDNLSFSDIQIPKGTISISTANIFPQTISTQQIDNEAWSNSYYTYSSTYGSLLTKIAINGEAVFSSPNGTKFPVSQNVMQLLDNNVGITGMVGDPQNQNLIFISTSNFPNPSDQSTCANKLYSYNVQTGDLVQFYSELNQNTSTVPYSSCSAPQAIGIQGSKLVLVDGDPNEIGDGPCFNIWADNSVPFLYIDLANIQNGLQKFTVPQNLIDNGQAQEQQCQNGLD
jgi:hypothetical protein